MDDEIHINRIKNNICAVSIKKLTNTGKDVKTFALDYFRKDNYILGEVIEASPVIYDSGIFQRKTWALDNNFISLEDFTKDNEVMFIRTSLLEQLFKKHPGLVSAWYIYFSHFIIISSKTITQEDIQETFDAVKKICIPPIPNQTEYEVILTPSIKDECLLGFIPRKGLYDIVKEHNSSYITNKSPQKCMIVDGELRIKLW